MRERPSFKAQRVAVRGGGPRRERDDLIMTLVDLEPGDPRLDTEVLPVLRELRPHLTSESFASVYEHGHPQGLRFTAAYVDGGCVGVAGWRIVATTNVLLKLYVDDLVTTDSARSRGVGRELLHGLTE